MSGTVLVEAGILHRASLGELGCVGPGPLRPGPLGYALVFPSVLGGRLPVTDTAEGKGSALTAGLWGTPGRKTSVS